MTRLQRQALDARLRTPRPPVAPEIDDQRAWFAELMGTMQVPAGLRTTAIRAGDRPALQVEPSYEPRPGTLLYLHGGSYVLGSPQTAMSLTGGLVERTGCRAVSIEYRLAPEHPFPAALDDALAAYQALLGEGVEPSSIALAGDSAGGGLAVTTCLAARDGGLPLPAAIVAFSPGLDLTRTGESMDSKAGIDPFFTRESLAHTGAMYLAGQDPNQELLSPATLADLTGFPPLLLQVGTNEMLLDDSVRLAARARAYGVDVVLDITADVPHVFQAYTGVLDEADQALDRAALFITQHLR